MPDVLNQKSHPRGSSQMRRLSAKRRRSAPLTGGVADYVETLVSFATAIEQDLEGDVIMSHRQLRLVTESKPNDAATARPGSDRRRAKRTKTVLRLVEVEHRDDHGLATCRNISDTGMKLALRLPVQLNDTVRVAFSPTLRIEGRIVWVNGKDCGVAFDGPIDSVQLLAITAAEARSARARPPRLATRRWATLVYEGRALSTVVRDMSQRGMKVTHDGSFRRGLRVTVILDDGTERPAVVRWVKDTIAGLMLLEPLSVEQLGSAGMPRPVH